MNKQHGRGQRKPKRQAPMRGVSGNPAKRNAVPEPRRIGQAIPWTVGILAAIVDVYSFFGYDGFLRIAVSLTALVVIAVALFYLRREKYLNAIRIPLAVIVLASAANSGVGVYQVVTKVDDDLRTACAALDDAGTRLQAYMANSRNVQGFTMPNFTGSLWDGVLKSVGEAASAARGISDEGFSAHVDTAFRNFTALSGVGVNGLSGGDDYQKAMDEALAAETYCINEKVLPKPDPKSRPYKKSDTCSDIRLTANVLSLDPKDKRIVADKEKKPTTLSGLWASGVGGMVLGPVENRDFNSRVMSWASGMFNTLKKLPAPERTELHSMFAEFRRECATTEDPMILPVPSPVWYAPTAK